MLLSQLSLEMTSDGQQTTQHSTGVDVSASTNDAEQLKMNTCIDSLSERIESALTTQQHDIKQQFHYVRSMLHHTVKMDDNISKASSIDADELTTANEFVDQLRMHLPQWIDMRSSIEVDEAIQQFASKFYRGEICDNCFDD